MDTATVITHPMKLASLGEITILSKEAFGPLGLNRYTIASMLDVGDKLDIKAIAARPYSFVFYSNVVEDTLSMCAQFLETFANVRPKTFDVQSFLGPLVTHVFPLLDSGEYLYVCTEEREYLNSRLPPGGTSTLIGYRAVTADPLCWINMQIDDALLWEGGCVIRSDDFLPQQNNIHRTLRFTELARRRGFRAEVKQEAPIAFGAVARDLSCGPVIFRYEWWRDMQLPLYLPQSPDRQAEANEESRKRVSFPGLIDKRY